MRLNASSANTTWQSIMSQLLIGGTLVSPRGIDTKELLFLERTFDMNSPVCYHQDRKLNYAFSAAEAYFIAHGDNRTENLVPYNRNMLQFSDDGLIFNGAYGPPFNDQLMYVVNTLCGDTMSRQAVLTIWKQNPVTSCDTRCTVALQFIIRDHCLHVKVTMRSSDVWLGIPYDFFNFTIMALRVLTLVNEKLKLGHYPIQLGLMNWSTGSSHAYKHDLDKIARVTSRPTDKTPVMVPERCYSDWLYVVDSLIACRDKEEDLIQTNNLWRIRP